ncbi:MAG TPA: redox-sensing transcriptional repressor Rex [Bacteroidales bacterium]|nr:redox-sensing transcriptional repressor Rex [Bacteroidales bacterium]HQQ13762.1 redox-sensing transcriptional repressor Rex [Bacteroidales bacterium]
METVQETISKKLQPVPEPSVRRMPQYLHLVRSMREKGEVYVSAPAIARVLNLDPTQVVKDMAYTGVTGKTRVGFSTEELQFALEEFLGYNRKHEAFLVGAGFLGSALIQYQGFREAGMKIVAAFDTDKRKFGTDIQGVPVFSLEKFHDLASRLHISIGIITTPAGAAQPVADLMVAWGIKAIWNFAPVALRVPEQIIVQDTHIYANLAVIINKLGQQKNG